MAGDPGSIQPRAFLVTDRELGTVGPAVTTDEPIESADYDRNGQLFVLNDHPGPDPEHRGGFDRGHHVDRGAARRRRRRHSARFDGLG